MRVKNVAATVRRYKGKEALRVTPEYGDAELPTFETLLECARSTSVVMIMETGQILIRLPCDNRQRLYTREEYEEARREFAATMGKAVERRA